MAQLAIQEVCNFSRLIEIPGVLKVVPNDADDDMVVEYAVLGKATHIVTGDKHLLTLMSYQNISIVKAADFLQYWLKPSLD